MIPKVVRNNARGWKGLHPLSQELYTKTYFKPEQSYEDWLKAITEKYSNNPEHADRIQSYIHNYWFHPSTPISSDRGYPISCYTSHVDDNRESIFYSFLEGMWLGAEGGGRGVYWGDVSGAGRPIGATAEELHNKSWKEIQANSDIPKSSGVIPFLGISDRATFAISQANVRRSTEAGYMGIWHSDVLAFKDIRLEAGDKNRRMHNLHNAIVITDEFMTAVANLSSWDLYDIKTGLVTDTVDAFDLWLDILYIRKSEAGEPFLLFIDTVNANVPPEYKTLGLEVFTSNICTEIMLHTDKDHSAVCCLGSANVEYYDEWKENTQFLKDISDYLHNVLVHFLKLTDGIDEALEEYRHSKSNRDDLVRLLAFERVRNSIKDSYDIGIGVMGWHSLLQKRNIPFESSIATGLNREIFRHLRVSLDDYQEELCTSNPELICPMSLRAGTKRRNIHQIAIAPTMGISNLADLTSSGIEPWIANAFAKTLIQGTYIIKNKYLTQVIINYAKEYGLDDEWINAQWASIIKHDGSVQQLDWMDQWTKDVYKTAYEINQLAVIQQAGDRSDYIDQGQSVNLFLDAEVTWEELHAVHYKAWEVGIKSLYYLRSKAEVSAKVGGSERKPIVLEDDACIACT